MRKVLFCILAVLLSVSCWAQNFWIDSMEVHGGVIWLGNADLDGENRGAPSPVTGCVKVVVPVKSKNSIELFPSISLFGLNYALQNEERPRPSQIEHREMYVIAAAIDLPVGYEFLKNRRISYSAYAGPSILLRIPAFTAPGEPNRSSEMNSYFYGSTRFFFLQIGGGAEYKFSQRVYFVGRMAARLPVFHFWDGESGAFYDQMMIESSLGIKILF